MMNNIKFVKQFLFSLLTVICSSKVTQSLLEYINCDYVGVWIVYEGNAENCCPSTLPLFQIKPGLEGGTNSFIMVFIYFHKPFLVFYHYPSS